METLTVGRAKLTWLNGGVTHMDGGAMFGVVPHPLWSKSILTMIKIKSNYAVI